MLILIVARADQHLLVASSSRCSTRDLGLVARDRRAVIIVILIAVPSHHQSFAFVFGHRINTVGLQPQHVLVLRAAARLPADDVHDHRLRRLGPHLRGDPRRRKSAPKGVWRSVFYSAVFGWIVLLALTFAATHVKLIDAAGGDLAVDHRDGADLVRGQGGAADLDRRAAVLRHGLRDQRLADDVRVLARRRRSRAQPVAAAEPAAGRRPGRSCSSPSFALHHHDPGDFKGNHLGLPVAFLAVTSISVIGLYIAYTIPVFLRWRMGDKFEPGPWTLGQEVQVDQPDRDHLGGAVRDHLLPAVHPGRGPVQQHASAGRRSTMRRWSRSSSCWR